MSDASFCTVVNCMDGRTQLPVNEYMRAKYDADYVDTITEPGPVKMLAAGIETAGTGGILCRIDISVQQHGSRAIAVVAHHDCAGNPADDEVQREQAAQSAEFLRQKYPEVMVEALWLGEDWQVQSLG